MQDQFMAGKIAAKKWATTGSPKYKWDMEGIGTSAGTRPMLNATHLPIPQDQMSLGPMTSRGSGLDPRDTVLAS